MCVLRRSDRRWSRQSRQSTFVVVLCHITSICFIYFWCYYGRYLPWYSDNTSNLSIFYYFFLLHAVVHFSQITQKCKTSLKSEKNLQVELVWIIHRKNLWMMSITFEHWHLSVFIQCQVDWPTKLFFAHGVVAGMEYLHSIQPHPVIHGDLKLLNVLVGEGLIAKVCTISVLCSSSFWFFVIL